VEDSVVLRFSGRITARPTPALLVAPARIMWMAIRYDPRRFREDPLVAVAQSRIRALEALDFGTLSWEGLLGVVREGLALPLALAGEPRERYLPRAAVAAGLLRMTLGLLGRGHLFGALFSGVDSRTVETNRALEALADRVRSDPGLADLFSKHVAGELMAALANQPAGTAFLSQLQAFLDRYGHREVAFSTMLEPTWKDAPNVVLGLIQGLAQTPPRLQTSRPSWEAAQAEVLAHPLLRLAPLRAAILALIAAARTVWQIREDTHFEATRSLPILRRTLLELGRRLTVVGVLDHPEAVFHLTFDELKHAGDVWPPSPAVASELRASVQRRQTRRAALEGTPVVDPRLYRQLAPSSDALLVGTPGSPGVAEGPVRIIREAAEFGKLRAGEVLVAPYTNPAWTPLFQRAAAVVVDAGAAGSHAAIVAREYGIPAVMGTITGTQTLHDGERVRVDGDQGQVTRLE
jgi:rifampicin phosphotransferase